MLEKFEKIMYNKIYYILEEAYGDDNLYKKIDNASISLIRCGEILRIVSNAESEFEMNLIMKHNQRRKGYMTEAIMAFAQEMPKKRNLVFFIKKDNISSLSTVMKLENVKEFTKDYQELNAKMFEDWRVFKIII